MPNLQPVSDTADPAPAAVANPKETWITPAFAAHLFHFEKTIKALDQDRTFFDLQDFPWTREVERDWRAMRDEVDRMLGAMEMLPGFEEIQVEQECLTRDRRWKIFPLYAYGDRFARNCARCPATARAIQRIPDLKVAMFSIFQAGKEVPPHRGPYGGVLRYHLGLKVPKPETQCGITVGSDRRTWTEGGSLVFDDSHQHHAWNHSAEDRVVLFVDFARPVPEHLREGNEKIIKVISETDFVGRAAANWAAWEREHGDRLDELLGCPPPA